MGLTMKYQDLLLKMSRVNTPKAQILANIISFAPVDKQAPNYLVKTYKKEEKKFEDKFGKIKYD